MAKPKIAIISNGGIIQQILTNFREDIDIEVEVIEKSGKTAYEFLDKEIELKQDGMSRDLLKELIKKG